MSQSNGTHRTSISTSGRRCAPCVATPQKDSQWYTYTGRTMIVPAVELDDGGRYVVCPHCVDGVHRHSGPDGLHAPGCAARRRYVVRGLAPAAYVRLMLSRLGFQAEQVQQIMDEIARTPHRAANQNA